MRQSDVLKKVLKHHKYPLNLIWVFPWWGILDTPFRIQWILVVLKHWMRICMHRLLARKTIRDLGTHWDFLLVSPPMYWMYCGISVTSEVGCLRACTSTFDFGGAPYITKFLRRKVNFRHSYLVTVQWLCNRQNHLRADSRLMMSSQLRDFVMNQSFGAAFLNLVFSNMLDFNLYNSQLCDFK